MDKVILAKNVVLEGGLGYERPNDNQLIIGGTGTGKSVSIMLPTMCHTEQSSLIGTFAKRSVVKKAASYFRKRGYATKVWNLADPKGDDAIPDPLLYLSSDGDVQELAKQIAMGDPEYTRATKFDPYWRKASESLITCLIYYVLQTEAYPSMKKVIDLFYALQIKESGKGIETTLDARFERLKRVSPDSVAVKKFYSFLQLPYTTAGCVRDDLEKAIQNMFPVSIQNAMSAEAVVDFKGFATEPTAIFIITSPVRTSQYAFANLLFSVAIRQLMEFAENREDNRLPRNVKLFFDDFSCGFPIIDYEKSISTFRSAGISSMMLCQSLSQLDATYGTDNSTVIQDNCSAIVYLPGGMNMRTCRHFAEMLNVPVDDVTFMGMGKVIVFQSGKKPIIAPRYDTFADPLYRRMMCLEDKEDSGERENTTP